MRQRKKFNLDEEIALAKQICHGRIQKENAAATATGNTAL